jgi:CheY-specific phosphatase CheX
VSFTNQTDNNFHLAHHPIEEKITTSWEKLAGYALNFAVEYSPNKPDSLDLYFMAPIKIVGEAREASIVLEICQTHARYLTSSMFAISENEAGNEDILDACAELCNVFSANIKSSIDSAAGIDLGIPENLKYEEFQTIFATGHLELCFKGQNKEGSVIVYLFNARLNETWTNVDSLGGL